MNLFDYIFVLKRVGNANGISYDGTASGLSATTVQGAIDELAGKDPHLGTITFSATWSGTDPYMQTVTVTGVTINSGSLISMQPSAAQLEQLIEDGVTAMVIENNSGILTAKAMGAAPTTAMTVQCVVTEVI